MSRSKSECEDERRGRFITFVGGEIVGIARGLLGRNVKGGGLARERSVSSEWRLESKVVDGKSCFPRLTRALARDFTFSKKVGIAGEEKSTERSSRLRRGRAKRSCSSCSST